jgi:hypothetical protein
MYRIARTALANYYASIFFGLAAFAAVWALLLSQRSPEILTSEVGLWWTALCAIAVLNVCAWHYCAVALARRGPSADPSFHNLQRWQRLLSAVYVLGCAFRSLVPRADVQRIGLIDSWVSSVLVGRSVATIAELCFVAQWALLLHAVSKDAGSRFGMNVARLLVPLIVVAEICSWYAVVTTCYLGNAIEESLWAVAAGLVVISCLALWSRCRSSWRPVLVAALGLGVCYVIFMCTVDVPMYLSRWLADEASGRPYLSLTQGLEDVWSRRVVTFDLAQWQPEIPWMSLYFSVAVWCSIALVLAPRFDRQPVLEPRDDSDPWGVALVPVRSDRD